MEVMSFRRAFAASLDADDFRKFVIQLRRAGWLRYWQEKTWRAFAAGHPDSDGPIDELLAALRVCEVHGGEIKSDDVEIFHGCLDYTDRYLRARVQLFPNAGSGPVSTEGIPFHGDSIEVWYCADCRTAESNWRRQHC